MSACNFVHNAWALFELTALPNRQFFLSQNIAKKMSQHNRVKLFQLGELWAQKVPRQCAQKFAQTQHAANAIAACNFVHIAWELFESNEKQIKKLIHESSNPVVCSAWGWIHSTNSSISFMTLECIAKNLANFHQTACHCAHIGNVKSNTMVIDAQATAVMVQNKPLLCHMSSPKHTHHVLNNPCNSCSLL